MPDNYRDDAIRPLEFLTFAERPLRLEEAIDAIVVYPDEGPPFKKDNRLPQIQDIAQFCSSLTTITTRTHEDSDNDDDELPKKTEELRLAHFSVKEYLTSDRGDEPFKQHLAASRAAEVIASTSIAYLVQASRMVRAQNASSEFPFAGFSTRQ
jgi:hypothetical protein